MKGPKAEGGFRTNNDNEGAVHRRHAGFGVGAVFAIALVLLIALLYFAGDFLFSLSYSAVEPEAQEGAAASVSSTSTRKHPFVDPPIVEHLPTPEAVRAVYITSWSAGTPRVRERIVKLINETELNAIVIDIKDFSGAISFNVNHPLIDSFGAEEERILDISPFIRTLHAKGIYVIGRITVFQDPHLARTKPYLAVKKDTNKDVIWTDYKGISYVDPGAPEMWKYITVLAEESYKLGFDELNFDYIRFPSDGNMRDIYFPFSEEQVIANPAFGKAEIVRDFFKFLHAQLKDTGAVLSADLFGMVTTNSDDLNIGQVLEFAEPYFDYLAPMVYPSHYPRTFIGFENPAAYPYEVVRYSMEKGKEKLLAASSTPEKLRPWLQDFDLGAVYDADLVRKQIQAVYDAGLDSWMLWDPANTYTREALLPVWEGATTSIVQ